MSKAAALDVAETVIDEVVETVDTIERIPNLALNGTTRKQQVVMLATVSVVSATAGAVGAALVVKKRVQAQYEQILSDQLQEAERHYAVLQEKPDLQEVAEQIEEAAPETDDRTQFATLVAPYQGTAPSVVEAADGTLTTTHVQNVWETVGAVGDWNQEVEESKRNPDDPYVISKDEYQAGELDHTMEELTYYVGDDTLAEPDDTAVPVHLVDKSVGEANLLRFGHGSDDPNIVYVRNPRLEIDYEITRNPGLYSKVVARFDEDDDETMARSRRR